MSLLKDRSIYKTDSKLAIVKNANDAKDIWPLAEYAI